MEWPRPFHITPLTNTCCITYHNSRYKDMEIIRNLDNDMVQWNYLQIKQDMQDIFQSEMERLLDKIRD